MPERGRPTQAGISVQDICYALPEHVVTGQALSAESPGWDIYCNLQRAGNTVSASLPILLKGALDAGRIAPGDTLFLCAFGAGLSWASAIVEWV